MRDAFIAGGPGMIPTAFFGAIMILASVLYAFRPEKRYVPLQISLGIATLAAGSYGFVGGLIKSFTAVGQVPAEDRYIWLIGLGESLNNLALAFGLLILAALLATVGSLRLALRPQSQS